MKVFIINGGQRFAHSGGTFHETLTNWTAKYFKTELKAEVKITNINDEYILAEEVAKYVWADIIIYHMPVWWFQVPFKVKEYFDTVFTDGHENGMYKNDGRSRSNANPQLHYGSGGLLQGRKYMLTTSWNAPIEAFTVENEFFDMKTPDDVFWGVHKMNEFVGMTKIEGFHFHDKEKNVTSESIEEDRLVYLEHLSKVIHEI